MSGDYSVCATLTKQACGKLLCNFANKVLHLEDVNSSRMGI